MWRAFILLVVCAFAGCGPSSHEMRERTLSVLNTEADRWDGGKDFGLIRLNGASGKWFAGDDG
jgi:hypothetical protein